MDSGPIALIAPKKGIKIENVALPEAAAAWACVVKAGYCTVICATVQPTAKIGIGA